MSYTMGTIMLTGSWGTGMRWVSCNWDPKQKQHTGFRDTQVHSMEPVWRVNGEETYKEEHLGLEHHGDGSRRGDGGSAGGDGETELDVPLQLSRLVGELQRKFSLCHIF